jgi:hypothetical protein
MKYIHDELAPPTVPPAAACRDFVMAQIIGAPEAFGLCRENACVYFSGYSGGHAVFFTTNIAEPNYWCTQDSNT